MVGYYNDVLQRQLMGKLNAQCALPLLVYCLHWTVNYVWKMPVLPQWGVVTPILLVANVMETNRTNPLRVILGEQRDQFWTNCHHLSLGCAFLYYTTGSHLRSGLNSVFILQSIEIALKGRSGGKWGARENGKSGWMRHIFLDVMAKHCLFTLFKNGTLYKSKNYFLTFMSKSFSPLYK